MIFSLASIVSVIDRGILTLVVDPIRHDLNIGDVPISLLQGLSFGLFYAVVGLPLGLMADRLSRHRLLVIGVATWSAATLFGGFAANFGELFVSRLLVGLGEAALAPCAVSMIADMFAPERRGRPISIYILGQAIAGGLGIYITGLVLRAVAARSFIGVPVLGGLAAWRVVFILCGLFGFLVVALLFTFREPVRRGVKVDDDGLGLGAAWRYLVDNRAVFVPFYIGYAVIVMHSYGVGAWNATFLIRRFAMTPGDVGAQLGGAAMLAGGVGALVAGFVVDRASRRWGRTAKFRLMFVIAALALPSAFVGFATDPRVAILGIAWTIMVTPMFGTTVIAAVQEMMPSNMRGLGISILGLTNTILGAAAAPLLIALATEHLYRDPAKIGWSISTVSIPALAIGVGLFVVALAALRRRLASPTSLRDVMMPEFRIR